MAFKISPRVYTVERHITDMFPDNMPNGAVKLHKAINSLKWEKEHIENNNLFKTFEDRNYYNILVSEIYKYELELKDKYPEWIPQIGVV